MGRVSRGLTLWEVALTLAVIVVLAAVAIPNFLQYQLRSKTSEAKMNLGAIRSAQADFHAAKGYHVRTPFGGIPNESKQDLIQRVSLPCSCNEFQAAGCDSWACLGFEPEGSTYYAYACEVTSDRLRYSCAALGDLDGDGAFSLFAVRDGNDSTYVEPATDSAPLPRFGVHPLKCPVEDFGVVDCAPGAF